MNTVDTNTNGTHAPSAAHTPAPAPSAPTDDADKPVAVLTAEQIEGVSERLAKLDARIAAFAVTPGDEETLAALALVRGGIATACSSLVSLPALLLDVSADVEKGKRPRGGEIVMGSIVKIKPAHRATFAGTLSAAALTAAHEIVGITGEKNKSTVTLRVVEGDSYTKLPLKRSQVELACDAAYEAGEHVRITQKYTAKIAATFGIVESALSDLVVVSCNGDKSVTLRASLSDGGSMTLPNVKIANVERC